MQSQTIPTVHAPAGTFKGFVADGCQQFLGIRYAISERYCAPVPYMYGSSEHECTMPAPYPVQLCSTIELTLTGIHYENLPQEESCQYLSISVPESASLESRLPVMVWYYGGSYRNGGCDNPFYDRSTLVKENGVIVVGINYRLSLLGFVKNREGGFANNGLLDAIEGLRWVHDNIASFGGDPTNITIFGESAGGDLVRCIMFSEGTDGLYRRAIIQSDPIGTWENREEMERKILDELNELPLDAPVERLLEAQKAITSHVTEKGLAKHMIFAPHRGVYPLPAKEDEQKRLLEVAPKHDLIIGTNARETASYIGGNKLASALDRNILTRWIIELYLNKMTKAIFREPTRKFARIYAECGGKVHLYSYFWRKDQHVIGAGHITELALLFGGKGIEGTLMAQDLPETAFLEQGKPLRRLWAEFARVGEISKERIEGMIEFE
jgi:para-nitrobenzyl esterase